MGGVAPLREVPSFFAKRDQGFDNFRERTPQNRILLADRQLDFF
jgi:hypothetical protein